MSIPFNAIDPEAERRRWVQAFEWHLDLIPPVLDAVIMTTLPTIPVSRGGSRFDRDQVTGGGWIDNMSDPLRAFDQGEAADGIAPSRAVADARELWAWLVGYMRAAGEWIPSPLQRGPILPDRVNPDPLTARALALTAVGWLIEVEDWVAPLVDLDEHRAEMFRPHPPAARQVRSAPDTAPPTREVPTLSWPGRRRVGRRPERLTETGAGRALQAVRPDVPRTERGIMSTATADVRALLAQAAADPTRIEPRRMLDELAALLAYAESRVGVDGRIARAVQLWKGTS